MINWRTVSHRNVSLSLKQEVQQSSDGVRFLIVTPRNDYKQAHAMSITAAQAELWKQVADKHINATIKLMNQMKLKNDPKKVQQFKQHQRKQSKHLEVLLTEMLDQWAWRMAQEEGISDPVQFKLIRRPE
jgi:hypothetical protein